MKSFAYFLSLGHVTSIPAQPRLVKNLLWCRLDLLTGLFLTTCLVDQDGWSSSPWTGLGQNRPENGPTLLGHMGHLGPCMHADGLDEAGEELILLLLHLGPWLLIIFMVMFTITNAILMSSSARWCWRKPASKSERHVLLLLLLFPLLSVSPAYSIRRMGIFLK